MKTGTRATAYATALVMLAALLTASGASAGTRIEPNYDNVRNDRWRCRLCPFESGTSGTVTVGAISVSDGASRFGRDTGLDDAGATADVNVRFRRRTESGVDVDLTATDLALQSRDVELAVGRPRSYDLSLRWREIPRNVSTTGRTPYSGDTTLTLPSDWVPAFDTSGMTTLLGSSTRFNDATKRETGSARLAVQLSPQLRFMTGFGRTAKEGTRGSYGDFLYQAAGLPKPVDYDTNEWTATLSWEADRFRVAVDYRNSRFSNGNDALNWQNAYADFVPNLRKGMAPDNQASAVSLVSSVNVAAGTTANATLTWGEATQDDDFLPYTTNSGLAVDPLPATGLNGQIDTFGATFNLVSRLTNRLRLTVSHRERERDNDTDVLSLTPVLGDLIAMPAEDSRVYSFQRSATELGLQYRLAGGVKLETGAAVEEMERTRLEIHRNEEDRVWFGVTVDNRRGLSMHAKYTIAERDASTFRDTTTNNPLTRRYYQAERDQNTLSAGFAYHFDGPDLSVGVDADWRENDYTDSVLGLLDDEDRTIGAHVHYAPGPHVAVSGTYERHVTESRTAGSVLFADPDWRYDTRDTVDTTRVSLALPGWLHERLDVSLNYALSEGDGDYRTADPAAESTFPALVSDYESVELEARYRLNGTWTLTGRYRFEDYDESDWALDGIFQDSVSNVVALGYLPPEHSVSLVSLSVTAAL